MNKNPLDFTGKVALVTGAAWEWAWRRRRRGRLQRQRGVRFARVPEQFVVRAPKL